MGFDPITVDVCLTSVSERLCYGALLCRIEELTCGGMVEQVQDAFGETMTSVVSLCARYPIACANSIGLLCTIPYTRSGKLPSFIS